ncbi:hypothetical protein EV421DRAFT_924352 [Armillaria borealis]|uniref:Uncharacterized protein n=1 Tax=Armillaria borealis TaxID=47425 RepID=A0AA39N088_9AGAR|nr:hypothetical protein EV421DRAFT_924352 [Armillaria borealis]
MARAAMNLVIFVLAFFLGKCLLLRANPALYTGRFHPFLIFYKREILSPYWQIVVFQELRESVTRIDIVFCGANPDREKSPSFVTRQQNFSFTNVFAESHVYPSYVFTKHAANAHLHKMSCRDHHAENAFVLIVDPDPTDSIILETLTYWDMINMSIVIVQLYFYPPYLQGCSTYLGAV